MFAVETYAAVRRFVVSEGHSKREAAGVFGLSRETVDKMCRFSAPPGYRRSKPPARPKLDPFVPLHHPAGHAQVDFGEAIGVINGIRRKLHVFFMSLPYSDA